MAELDFRGICKDCKYWVYKGHAGECYRYPTIAIKYEQHWCGEYVERKVINLTVEPQVTTGTIKLEPIKKRGRPAHA